MEAKDEKANLYCYCSITTSVEVFSENLKMSSFGPARHSLVLEALYLFSITYQSKIVGHDLHLFFSAVLQHENPDCLSGDSLWSGLHKGGIHQPRQLNTPLYMLKD